MRYCSGYKSNVIFVKLCVTWHHFLLWLNWASAPCLYGSVKFIHRKCSLSSDLTTTVPHLPEMTFNTRSWSVKEDFNKAKIKLEIPNFSDVLGKTTKGQRNPSKQIEVRGSKFALGVFPKGCGQAEKGMPSAFLYNESDHDVIVDFIFAVEGCKESWKNTKIERKNSKGKIDFMRVSNMIDNDFIITVVHSKMGRSIWRNGQPKSSHQQWPGQNWGEIWRQSKETVRKVGKENETIWRQGEASSD